MSSSSWGVMGRLRGRGSARAVGSGYIASVGSSRKEERKRRENIREEEDQFRCSAKNQKRLSVVDLGWRGRRSLTGNSYRNHGNKIHRRDVSPIDLSSTSHDSLGAHPSIVVWYIVHSACACDLKKLIADASSIRLVALQFRNGKTSILLVVVVS